MIGVIVLSLLVLFAVLSQAALLTDAPTCVYEYGNVTTVYPNPPAPEVFRVEFVTNLVQTNGEPAAPIVMEVHRAWAPIGADHFYALMQDRFYDCAAFFRVVPDFVVQYGIAASPAETAKWNTTIPDDPVLMSNVPWTVSYATAGPDTRTSQIFINYVDNSRLDESGFAPFAKVISGFDTAIAIDNPTPDDSDGIDQDKYSALGNAWLLPRYPDVSFVTTARLADV